MSPKRERFQTYEFESHRPHQTIIGDEMNKLKVGDIVVVTKHKTHLIDEGRFTKIVRTAWDNAVPIGLITEVEKFRVNILNITSIEGLPFSTEYLMLRKATDREKFFYLIEGMPCLID